MMAWGLAVAALAEATSYALVRVVPHMAPDMPSDVVVGLFGREPLPPMPLFMFQSGGLALFVIGLCMALAEKFPRAFWLKPLAHCGQMALTLYIAHVIIGMGILEAIGRFENQPLGFSVTAAVVFCLTSIPICHLWRKHLTRGPLERLMRKITG